MSLNNVGQIRPSQLLWTYGPGALIDLPNLSVLTMGLDRWQEDRCLPVEEPRLLAAVRRALGPQVDRLRMPPVNENEDNNNFSPEAKIGVPVRPFPRWLRCVRCGMLGETDSGLFELKPNPYRPEQTHYIHKNCSKGKNVDAVPSRFLLACRNGHLDDFPWRWYLHEGQGRPDCNGPIAFFEDGASLQTENLWVKCQGCDTPPRSLVHAFGKEGAKNLPACRGRHPHLSTYEECCEAPRAVLLGATNSWFSMSLSVLAIPQEKDPVAQMVADNWAYFEDAESEAEVKIMVKAYKKSGAIPGIDKHFPDELWAAIDKKRQGVEDADEDFVSEEDIKRPEWKVLTSPSPPADWPTFSSTATTVPTEYSSLIDSVLLLDRLREVNALIGFTRVEPPEESLEPEEQAPMAKLTRGKPTWVPASEVHGEGIFIRIKESELVAWEKKDAVKKRDVMLRTGHEGWRTARQMDPSAGYPGIRYAMLHTLSHLLIRELALECGYNAASIRERIYASEPGDDEPMAGVLLYTAAADSDGTLGGLVDLGKPDTLGHLIKQALRRSEVCSADPLCSEHNPASDRTIHGASCHACGFVAETSCEKGNRYLDRALLVPVFECPDTSFFPPTKVK